MRNRRLDAVTIAHPNGLATAATTALILGGPLLYLAGYTLFKWVLWRYLRRSRLVAIGALLALAPLAERSSTLGAGTAAMLVLVTLALWDRREERRVETVLNHRSPASAPGQRAMHR